MKKRLHTYGYKLITNVSVIVILVLVLFGMSQILAYLNTGADRASILHLPVDKKPVYLPKVIWHDTINPGRPMEEHTLKDIEIDYLNAWYIRNVAFQTNTTVGLSDYYTTSALENITAIVHANTQNEITNHKTTIDHNLYLDFYSADGQLAVISDCLLYTSPSPRDA